MRLNKVEQPAVGRRSRKAFLRSRFEFETRIPKVSGGLYNPSFGEVRAVVFFELNDEGTVGVLAPTMRHGDQTTH
jgi:hypothetical protein